jgi:hypothetical protein
MQSSAEDEAQSSHLEHGILSEEQEGLIEQSEDSTGLNQKLVDKQLSRNDQIIMGDDGEYIKKSNEDDLNDMNIVI